MFLARVLHLSLQQVLHLYCLSVIESGDSETLFEFRLLPVCVLRGIVMVKNTHQHDTLYLDSFLVRSCETFAGWQAEASTIFFGKVFQKEGKY
jgi:hypothetical protein